MKTEEALLIENDQKMPIISTRGALAAIIFWVIVRTLNESSKLTPKLDISAVATKLHTH